MVCRGGLGTILLGSRGDDWRLGCWGLCRCFHVFRVLWAVRWTVAGIGLLRGLMERGVDGGCSDVDVVAWKRGVRRGGKIELLLDAILAVLYEEVTKLWTPTVERIAIETNRRNPRASLLTDRITRSPSTFDLRLLSSTSTASSSQLQHHFNKASMTSITDGKPAMDADFDPWSLKNDENYKKYGITLLPKYFCLSCEQERMTISTKSPLSTTKVILRYILSSIAVIQWKKVSRISNDISIQHVRYEILFGTLSSIFTIIPWGNDKSRLTWCRFFEIARIAGNAVPSEMDLKPNS
jgi:hypothetical protein